MQRAAASSAATASSAAAASAAAASEATQTLFLRSRTLAALAPTPLAASTAPPQRPASGAGTEAALVQLISELRVTWRPLQQPVVRVRARSGLGWRGALRRIP